MDTIQFWYGFVMGYISMAIFTAILLWRAEIRIHKLSRK
jgi:hypothetical protein